MSDQHMPRRLLGSNLRGGSSFDASNVFVLLLVFFASGFFVLTLTRCLRTYFFRSRSRHAEIARRHQHALLFGTCDHGLTQSAIAAIPTYAFQRDIKHGSGSGGGWAQCAICLSILEESEMVRQLPECKHLFHVECIDKWLDSHATCPLCRSSVAGAKKDLEAQTSDSDVGGSVDLP